MAERSNLHRLSELGQSIWIDYLSRNLLHSGELERMMREDAVVGVTSNPTIFQKAISQGNAYDDQLRACLDELTDPKEIFLHLTRDDVSDACDLLRRVWDEGKGQDGYVSWEVDPNLAYDRDATFEEAKRLHGLAAKGATKQRCLWASTSVKNPDYRDTMYVEELIGPQTVNTMPQETIEAFQEHGKVAPTLELGLDEARRLFDDLAAAGIDYDDVGRVLEEEGVQKFVDSFTELLDGVQSKKHELVGA